MSTKSLKFSLSFSRPSAMTTERFKEVLAEKIDIKKFLPTMILGVNDNNILRHSDLTTVEKLNLTTNELRGNKRVEQTT